MGDSDLEVNDYKSTECSFADARRDCDGDWDTYCTKSEIVLIRIGNVIVTATTLYFVVHDKLQMLKHYKKG